MVLAAVGGANLPALAFREFSGAGTMPCAQRLPDGLTWLNEDTDWAHVRSGKLGALRFLRQLLGADSHALWWMKDPLPAGIALGRLAAAGFGALRRKLLGRKGRA